MGEVVDLDLYRTKKQMEETKAWLAEQNVMPIPCLWPMPEDDKPSDTE